MMRSLDHFIEHLIVKVVEELSPKNTVVPLVAIHSLHEPLVLVDEATHSTPTTTKEERMRKKVVVNWTLALDPFRTWSTNRERI